MEEWLTVYQLADKLGYHPNTIRTYTERIEFAPYRKDKPTKILWCPETEKILKNLYKKAVGKRKYRSKRENVKIN